MQQSPRDQPVKVRDVKELQNLINDKDKDVTKVRSEYIRLTEQFKTQVKDKQAVIEKLTNDDANLMKRQLALRNRILELQKQNEKAMNDTTQQMEDQMDQINKLGQNKLEQGDVKLNEVNEDLLSMKQIEKKKVLYELELFEWDQQCKLLQDKITQTKYNNQIELAKMKRQIEAEYDANLAQFKAEAQQDAQRNIQEIERNIHLENQKLALKTMSQRYELDYYKREIGNLKDMNQNFKRDINLNQGTEVEYVARADVQQKKLAAYRGKVQILEQSLSAIVGDFEKEKELVRYQHEAIIKEQREDIINARENLRVKNRELRNVRALAQVILDQRSEVEQFFLEALEQIKDEIRKKALIEKRSKNRTGTAATGSTQSGENGLDPNKPFTDKVDLNDLEWEDRERVLRLLFSKMNAGIPMSTLAKRASLKDQQIREAQMRQLSEEAQLQLVQQEDGTLLQAPVRMGQYLQAESEDGSEGQQLAIQYQ